MCVGSTNQSMATQVKWLVIPVRTSSTRESLSSAIAHRPMGWLHPVDWMRDGSFHGIRRLAQDVPGWWAQVEGRSGEISAPPMAADPLAAKLVGRWRSGTPLAQAPDRDQRSRDPRNDNDFGYSDDPEGTKTPRFAHIRKVYPRDGAAPGEVEAQTSQDHPTGDALRAPLRPGEGTRLRSRC